MKIERLAAAGVLAISAINCGGGATAEVQKEPAKAIYGEGYNERIFHIARLSDGDDKLLITPRYSDRNSAAQVGRGVLYMREKGCNITDMRDVQAGQIVTVKNPNCLPIK